jgi:hypothetical protein
VTGTPYSRPCAARGCTRAARRWRFSASGWPRYCERCRQRARRHGHPEQVPIRKPELTEYVKRVKQLISSRERIETYLREQAAVLADVAQMPEARSNGAWVVRWKQKATEEMVRVLRDVDPISGGVTVAAVFLMRDQQPRRFVSDPAFRTQLVRLWRSQTRLAFGSFWNQRTDKVVSVYKDLPPRVVETIALFLVEAYARFAGYVISADRREKDRATALDETLDAGFTP